MRYKKTIDKLIIGLLIFISLLPLYLIVDFTLSHIPSVKEKPGNDITIFLTTNGVHTDLVLPVKTPLVDWSKEVKFDNTLGNDTTAKHVAFGWGDRGFYLETPTWAELKPSVAIKAATGYGRAAIHTVFYRQMTENKNCARLVLSNDQYKRLVRYIQNSFKTDLNGHEKLIRTTVNYYGPDDAFYEATGSYSIFHTCNTWTNTALKAAGQKACLWTASDKGLMRLYNK